MNRWRDWILLITVSITSSLLVWLPFMMQQESFWTIPLPKGGMQTVVSNFDGPYYLVVVKSWYSSAIIKTFEFDEPVEYYAAHFPGYPAVVWILYKFLSLPYAMLAATLIFSSTCIVLFYEFLNWLKLKNALWISLVFLILPFRWLQIRSIGSPEPQFIFFTILAIWMYMKNKYWWSGIAGGLAVLTKSPGILLFVAMGMDILWNSRSNLRKGIANWLSLLPWNAFPIILIPASLIGLWSWYGTIYGSFWAYFESGDNLHLFWPPFQVFNRQAPWVGDFWLEEVLWIFLIGGAGVLLLWRRQDILSWYSLIFFVSILFVSHRDISRYSLPIMPFMLFAYSSFLNNKEVKIALAILIIPIYLFTLNYLSGNVTPISDWGKFL